jgi:hypothetical protein
MWTHCHVSHKTVLFATSVPTRPNHVSVLLGVKLHGFCRGHIPRAPHDVVCQARSASQHALAQCQRPNAISKPWSICPEAGHDPPPPSTARLVAAPTLPSLSHTKGIRSGWGPSSALALTKIGTPYVLHQDRRTTTLPTAGSQGGTPPLGSPQHGQDYTRRQ